MLDDEEITLSPLAVKSRDNEGREYPEEDHLYRLPFQRDRDRIVHCNAFKRLEFKTQVFIYSYSDHYRNRLTHTLEVAGISRTVSSALGLNTYLAEVIALAHDLGHAPFGHAGQEILAVLMKDHGGFEHNKQSLRIVTRLEKRYPGFPGLNLTRATLKGIMKHASDYEKSGLLQERQDDGPALEALIADYSDEIAYNTHDIEDGLASNMIHAEEMMKIELWRRHYERFYEEGQRDILLRRSVLRAIMNDMVTDLITNTAGNLEKGNIKTRSDLNDAWHNNVRLVGYSSGTLAMVRELKKFLKEKLYRHPDVMKMSDRGQEIIEKLFVFLLKNPDRISPAFAPRVKEDDIHRVVCDYIAGMTDRYAEEFAGSLSG